MAERPCISVIPVPIRADLVVRVALPDDLTVAEAEKVARVILAYAKPDLHAPIDAALAE